VPRLPRADGAIVGAGSNGTSPRAALEADVALARAEDAELEVVEPRQLPSLEPRMR
jgi:hypothetical protein